MNLVRNREGELCIVSNKVLDPMRNPRTFRYYSLIRKLESCPNVISVRKSKEGKVVDLIKYFGKKLVKAEEQVRYQKSIVDYLVKLLEVEGNV